MAKRNMKAVIYQSIYQILMRENKEYATLDEIYHEVSSYLEMENNAALQSQIRGRLQEFCEQYPSFRGEDLFLTEKVRSGKWTIKREKNCSSNKYIRYTKYKYLVSHDNWKTFELMDNITDHYVSEQNVDCIYQVKLMHEIGKEKATIILEQLQQIRHLLKQMNPNGNIQDQEGYGLAFEVFAISVLHNVDYEKCIRDFIVHGSLDGGIDAIYYDEGQNVSIYQIKMDALTDTSYETMQKSYDECSRGVVPNNGKDLYDFFQRNKVHLRNKIMNLKSVSKTSKQSGNYLLSKIYDRFFENKLLPLKQNELTLLISKPVSPNYNGRNYYNVSKDEYNNFIFYMSAEEIIQYLVEALGIPPHHYDADKIDISKYFFDNVRGFLSVNKKMVATIENEPENFVKYNNGISITGEVTDLGNKILIYNPVINNGQQSITTLIKTKKNLNKIILPIKITNESDQVIKGKISQFSNEQVKVKAIDMLSLNTHVRNLQKTIFSETYENENYFLEIYSSGKKGYVEIVRKLYPKNCIIELLDFIKLYFSVQNKKELGIWKNSPSNQIEKTVIDQPFDTTLAFKVCKAIVVYENYMEKVEIKKDRDDFKSADLAFKYLLCNENLEVEDVASIIRNVNQTYYYNVKDEKSKLIDIYKSSTIIYKLEKELELYKCHQK